MVLCWMLDFASGLYFYATTIFRMAFLSVEFYRSLRSASYRQTTFSSIQNSAIFSLLVGAFVVFPRGKIQIRSKSTGGCVAAKIFILKTSVVSLMALVVCLKL